MASHIIFMANGCEEIEGLTAVDLLRRAGDTVDMVSITDSLQVEGAHGISFMADCLISDLDASGYDSVILPGGGPGYINLSNNASVKEITTSFNNSNKLVAAICASPTVLGGFGLLEKKEATCYPGMEDGLIGAIPKTDSTVWAGNILTSRGVGTAIDFALEIIRHFHGDEAAESMATTIVYR